MVKYHKLFFFFVCVFFFLAAVHMLILYICFQMVGSKALWSLCLLLYVLPTQNKSCLVLSCLVLLFGVDLASKAKTSGNTSRGNTSCQ